MPRTLKIDSLKSLRRYLAGPYYAGREPTLREVLEWIDGAQEGQAWKPWLLPIVVHDVARLGTPGDLHQLAVAGVNLRLPCTPDRRGHALHVAARHGRVKVALALVEMGLDPRDRWPATREQPTEGFDAFEEALAHGHPNVFAKLLARASTVLVGDRDRWLRAAVSRGGQGDNVTRGAAQQKSLEAALAAHPDADLAVLNEALATAAGHGWRQAFHTLVRAGADPATPALVKAPTPFDGSALQALVAQTPPGFRASVVRAYGTHFEALAPAATMDTDALATQLAAHRGAAVSDDLADALAPLRAWMRQHRLEDSLGASATAPRRLRM